MKKNNKINFMWYKIVLKILKQIKFVMVYYTKFNFYLKTMNKYNKR